MPNAMSKYLSFQPIPSEFLMRSKLSPIAAFVLRGILLAPFLVQSIANPSFAQEPDTQTKPTIDKTSDRLEAIEGVLGKIVQELQSIKQPKAPEVKPPATGRSAASGLKRGRRPRLLPAMPLPGPVTPPCQPK